MKVTAAAFLLLYVGTANALAPISSVARSLKARTSSLNIVVNDKEEIVAKARRIASESKTPESDPAFAALVQEKFPGAIDNSALEECVVSVLAKKGFSSSNTLLATSLCCDELARELEDDFVRVYGNNFNLGGLSGFPFAGNTGFGAMAAHIPDDGCCLLIYGPHVGISANGVVGKVERNGIALVDTCCGSAVAALGYLKGITEGGAQLTTSIQTFTDFQQQAVRELILPHGKRLTDAKDQMIELPYALYESQDIMVRSIVNAGANGVKKGGIALLGGIQINTGPNTPDYFHPLRFDLMDSKGEVVEDMLKTLSPEATVSLRKKAMRWVRDMFRRSP